MSTKQRVLPSTFNSFENSYLETLDHSHLSARNSMQKYTERKHWIEKNKRGYRYCYATFDSKRNSWCKPVNSTYSEFRFMCFSLSGELRTNGFNTYTETDTIRGLKDRYDLDADQIQVINIYADHMDLAKEKYEEMKAERTVRILESRRDFTSYSFDKIYNIEEINKCTTDLKLLKLSVVGHAVKRRCRKTDYFNDCIGYLVLDPETEDNASHKKLVGFKHLLESETKAMLHLRTKFKEITAARYEAKDCGYEAPNESGSGFYGMKQMLMADPLAMTRLIGEF